MNIVNKLTVRHLKQNKRRTLVTIIGVIISVAMITAVSILGISFLDLMKRQIIADDGEWHAIYQGVSHDQYEAIQEDERIKTVMLSKDLGYSRLEGSQNKYKPYLFIKGYNQEGFKRFPIELSSGRLPQSDGEIILSEEIAENGNVRYKIGDTLELKIGDRIGTHEENRSIILTQMGSLQEIDGEIEEELKINFSKSYKVVGFIKRPTWEPTWSPGYTVLTYIDDSMIADTFLVNASTIFKKVDNSLYSHVEQIAAANKIESFDTNNSLLRYYGVTDNDGLKRTLYSLSAIIMTVIIVGSVALIYNAFAISVSERSRHLGMLASVGATKKQKRNSVFFEGLIIAVISIPIGIISGIAGIGITFLLINSAIQGAFGVSEKLTVVVTPASLLIACGISLITIFISTYVPAMKASRITAIDAIRQSTDIKLTGKAVKTSKFVRKLFGLEAEIGLKNMKRNKRRYQVTIFSLVISIVLFLTVSFFTNNLKKSLTLSQSGVNFDIQVSLFGENVDNLELQETIVKLDDVTESSIIKELIGRTWIEEKALADDLKAEVENDRSILENGKYPYSVKINTLDAESLKKYAKVVGIDYDELTDPEKKAAIVIDTIPYEDMEQEKYREIKVLYTEEGQSLDIYTYDYEGEEERHLSEIKIAALTDEVPMGMVASGLGAVNVIVSEPVMEQIVDEEAKSEIQKYIYLNSSDPMETQEVIEEMEDNGIGVYNIYQARQQEEQMLLLMSVFTYGFIVLISAISIANIFNTISTSISLRKREFAMLKSVGMTPKGFNKMINYESIFYGVKSLVYGLPLSIVVMYLIHRSLMNSFGYEFTLPWMSMFYVIIAVFVIVSSAMLYSTTKVRRENIIDAIKQENI